MPSTADLSTMPTPSQLKKAMRFAAMLDIVLCDDQWLRCYDFQPNWSADVAMAKYDNGGGNDMFVFFRTRSVVIKGFDHESPVSRHARDDFKVWPGIYDGLPSPLAELLNDKAVQRDDVTFCVWHSSGKWRKGSAEFSNEDDGSSYLLGMILQDAAEFLDWASEYYERELDLDAIAAVYAGKPIDESLIKQINPERKAKAALKELAKLT